MRRPALALLLGCLLLVAGASALDGYDYYQTIEYAACDQDIYQQDIVIHRTTGTAYNETAGGLETWHIYVGEHCREDYGDIRFTNSTGAELAYYLWPDYDSSSARFCVRLEGADQGGVLMIWYGSPTATTTSDGDATFPLIDNFNGVALDTTKWTSVGSIVPTVSDGNIKFIQTVGTPLQRCIVSKQTFTPGEYQMQFRFRLHPTSGYAYSRLFCGFIPSTSDNTGAPCVSQHNSNRLYSYYVDHYTSFAFTHEEWYDCLIRKSADNKHTISIGDTTSTSTTALAGDTVYLGGWYVNGDVDWVVVRAYSATPPAATTFSGEQETAAPPLTAFTATPTAGLAPLTVQFTDTSAGRPTSWLWTFGDGGTSTDQNPQHTYTTPGLYSVTLTATNEYGSDDETKTDYITVYGPVSAQFTATPTGGTAPLIVQFTDLSTGGPTSWLWDFGDGGTSTEQNPQHTYTTAGPHTVTLTASHPYDSDTETKTSYITVAVLQPFPGLTNIPRDLAGNGLYTDINGNNRLDYNDLTVFFQNLAWAKTAQPIACFDFNGNGWLDYNDVITLFSTIMEEHT